jgi:hypothetical protein
MIDWDKALPILVAAAVSLLGIAINLILTFEFRRSFERRLQEERYKLEQELKIRSIKFEKIYATVADVIDKIFELTIPYFRSGELLIRRMPLRDPEQSKAFEEFIEQGNELMRYVGRHRIYLPPELYTAIVELFFKLQDAATHSYRPPVHEIGKEKYLELHNKMNEEFERLTRPLFEELCKKLQQFIGLVEADKK